MVEDANGFLGRWARRKNDALQGKPLQEPVAVVPPAALTASPEVTSRSTAPVPAAQTPTEPDSQQPPARELSLDDAKLLTKDSDFKPFMANNVGPDVRNAAMKKLFADPHFNVMDGLDIYIDDYSISEPIPESMLRQMASAKFLKLFDDDEDDEKGNEKVDGNAASDSADNMNSPAPSPREIANNPTPESVAHSAEEPQNADSSLSSPPDPSQPESLNDSGASPKEHDHTDLRLQPDDAAPTPETGRRTQ